MKNISITKFQPIEKHPYLRALADLTLNGIHLRGLRLEQRKHGELTLGFPGRKIQGRWQVVYEAENRDTKALLLESLVNHYHGQEKAA